MERRRRRTETFDDDDMKAKANNGGVSSTTRFVWLWLGRTRLRTIKNDDECLRQTPTALVNYWQSTTNLLARERRKVEKKSAVQTCITTTSLNCWVENQISETTVFALIVLPVNHILLVVFKAFQHPSFTLPDSDHRQMNHHVWCQQNLNLLSVYIIFITIVQQVGLFLLKTFVFLILYININKNPCSLLATAKPKAECQSDTPPTNYCASLTPLLQLAGHSFSNAKLRLYFAQCMIMLTNPKIWEMLNSHFNALTLFRRLSYLNLTESKECIAGSSC